MKPLLIALTLAVASASYQQEITEWRAHRLASLTKPDGWLSLVWLSWIHEGVNDVPLPSTPTVKAHVTLQKGVVTLSPSEGMTIDGKHPAGPVVLRNDTDPAGPTVVHLGDLTFQVIKRNDKYAFRIKDPQSPARTHFKGIGYFPIDESYRVEARFEPYNPPKKVPITNILGMTSMETSPGLLAFELHGKKYKVEPVLEEGETDWFIVFKDTTSGRETYGAARFLYAAPPDKDGKTVIDFNKAYNPPCAFTPYATCPLPQPQNRLAVAIRAGEKKYH